MLYQAHLQKKSFFLTAFGLIFLEKVVIFEYGVPTTDVLNLNLYSYSTFSHLFNFHSKDLILSTVSVKFRILNSSQK